VSVAWSRAACNSRSWPSDDLAERFTGERLVVVAHDAVNRHLLALLVPAMAADPAEIPQRPGLLEPSRTQHTSWTAAVVDAMPYEGGHP
jgi:hypothetical protein